VRSAVAAGGPLIAVTLVVGLTATIVERVAPASLLLPPTRFENDGGNPEVRTEGSAYPRHATGADNVRVTIARPPRRVVSQDRSIDEYLYSVEPPERVVGVSQSAFERRLSNVYADAERYRPIVAGDPEIVVRANPDLVLVSSSARADFTNLLRLAGIPVYRMFTLPTTLTQIEDQLRVVGYLTGRDDQAAVEIARFRQAILRASARRPGGAAPPRVLGLGGEYSYGSRTLFHDVLHALGAVNVAAEHGLIGYDALADERIAEWNPEWIVAGAGRGKAGDVFAELIAQPAIAGTTAAARRQIVVLDDRVFLPLSPFTSALVGALADVLYGGRP
jgi:iron complex transport system substrate-binding protein